MTWIQVQLQQRGLSVTGPVEPRDRPWSVVMRIPTDQGSLWFKANAPASSFEPALTRAIGQWAPGRVLTPLAVDTDRGLLLLPDGGTSLRALFESGQDVRAWEEPLRQYAVLQRTLAGHVDELLKLGLPDLRPAALAEQYDGLLDSPQVQAQVGVPDGLPATRYEQLRALRPTVERWCELLSAVGVPPSVDHADLHDGQVFQAAGGWAFIDWADASVGHPFCSLRIALQRAAERFSLAPGAAELDRLRDAYLEPWTGEHDVAELREAARLAVRLGAIGTASAWRRVFPEVEAIVWDVHGREVVRLLSRLLDPEPA